MLIWLSLVEFINSLLDKWSHISCIQHRRRAAPLAADIQLSFCSKHHLSLCKLVGVSLLTPGKVILENFFVWPERKPPESRSTISNESLMVFFYGFMSDIFLWFPALVKQKIQYSPFQLFMNNGWICWSGSSSPVEMSLFPKSARSRSRTTSLDNCGSAGCSTRVPPPSADGMWTWVSWVVRSSPGALLTSVDFSLWNIYGAQAEGWSCAAGIPGTCGVKGIVLK